MSICNTLSNEISFSDKYGFRHINRTLYRKWNCPIRRKTTSSSSQTFYRQTMAMQRLGIAAAYRCHTGTNHRRIYPWKDNRARFIADDKVLTSLMVRFCGYSSANPSVIDSNKALEGFIRQAEYPVVVKPRHGSQGHGVVLNVNETKLRRIALDRGYNMIVERQLPALPEFRLFGIDGHLVYAVERRRARIKGRDGVMLSTRVREENTYNRAFLENLKRYSRPKRDVPTYSNATYVVSRLVNTHQGGQSFQVPRTPSVWKQVVADITAFFPLTHRLLAIDIIADPANESPKQVYVIEVNETPGVTLAFTAAGPKCPMELDFKMSHLKFQRLRRPVSRNPFERMNVEFFAQHSHGADIQVALSRTLAKLG